MSPPLFPSLLLALSTSTHATGSPAIGERESDCEALGCSISLSLFSLLLLFFVVVSAPTLLRSFLCVKVADCPQSVHADTTKFLCHVLQRGVASVDFVLEFVLSSLFRTDLCRVKAS